MIANWLIGACIGYAGGRHLATGGYSPDQRRDIIVSCAVGGADILNLLASALGLSFL